MSLKKELNNEQLEKVSGGNHGDKSLEYGETADKVKYLYNVDQHVEVFLLTLIHKHTKGGTIIERKPIYLGQIGGADCWCGEYLVRFDEGGQDQWVKADQIER